jgi:hypothetical protein
MEWRDILWGAKGGLGERGGESKEIPKPGYDDKRLFVGLGNITGLIYVSKDKDEFEVDFGFRGIFKIVRREDGEYECAGGGDVWISRDPCGEYDNALHGIEIDSSIFCTECDEVKLTLF